MMEKYELTDQIDKPELIKGISIELGHGDGKLSPKQSNFLNKMFWDRLEVMQFYKIVGSWPHNTDCIIGIEEKIKVWFGRQLGEVIIGAEYDPKIKKKVVASTKKNVIGELRNILGLSEFLANKYLNLNQSGWLDKFKTQSLTEYWYWRADIDLRDYKQILGDAGL